jgi:hypothetical protein
MNAKFLLSFSALFFVLQSYSQQRLVTCSSKRNPDGTISILAENKGFVDLTVKLIFTDLTGYRSSENTESLKTVGTGSTEIARLTDQSSSAHSFNYRYRAFPGHFFNKQPDTSVVYLLPSTSNHTLRVSKVSPIGEVIGQKKTEDFFSTGFRYSLGDTICASRAGTVFQAVDTVRGGEQLNQFYRSGRNRISIEHKDGTLGHYSMLAPIKLLVAPGDEVIPGQPLAVFDKESPKYVMMFAVEYLDGKKLLADNGVGDPATPSFFAYLPAYFYVDASNKARLLEINKQYTVMYSKEVIAAELTKKEKRKLGLL